MSSPENPGRFTLSFAEASHELLVRSLSEPGASGRRRLRQYLKLYVRITKGDVEWQFGQLRELIDAGLFVLEGGADTPRTKTKDGDPIQQFVLTYRKLFGLSNFIGLADRDRFELSGEDLLDWLKNPSRGKEILLRNLGGPEDEDGQDDSYGGPVAPQEDAAALPPTPPMSRRDETADQMQLSFLPGPDARELAQVGGQTPAVVGPMPAVPMPRAVSADELREVHVDHLLLGLGFEERALASAVRLMELTRPRSAVLVSYEEPGRSEEILRTVRRVVPDTRIVNYSDLIRRRSLGPMEGNVLVDITGLAKPVLFESLRAGLRASKRIWVAHTSAEVHYPLHEDIVRILEADRTKDHYTLLDELSRLMTGEEAPYRALRLIESDADESRRRVLCAFASAKHQRLLTLIDEREFDRVEVVVPGADSPRGQIARIAGEVAVRNVRSGRLTQIKSYDLLTVLNHLRAQYREWYIDRGFNFELGLTGSKLQAVACAILSASLKLSQCWYVAPARFDVSRFTTGVGASAYWEIGPPHSQT